MTDTASKPTPSYDPALLSLRTMWPKLTPRVLDLLFDPARTYGLILQSRDNSAYTTALKLVQHFSPSVLTFENHKQADWFEKVLFIREAGVHSAILGPQPGHVCLFVPELDTRPEWLQFSLKGMFEHHVRPWVCIATAADIRDILLQVSSHFFTVKKSGRTKTR